jgi:hypothetical protein
VGAREQHGWAGASGTVLRSGRGRITFYRRNVFEVSPMSVLVFDTHAYIKKLTSVGFTEEQAEVQAEVLANLIEEQLATKRDLKELEERLTYRLTLRLGSMMVAAVAVVAALVKLL